MDVEFTLNFQNDREYCFNLVQCRPLQTRGLGKTVEIPLLETKEECLFYSEGNFMGGNLRVALDKIIFVEVDAYLACPEQDKYQVARCIGRLNQLLSRENVLLLGPGRWGTTTPSLGVPVNFTEISNMAAICEMSWPSRGIMPEVSYGSHFFQDLVESGVFYIALFQEQESVIFREEKLQKENLLCQLVPEYAALEKVIRVTDAKGMELYSDITKQQVFCR